MNVWNFSEDSVLKLFTSKLLYEIYPEAPEGELSKIRSILVSDAILAQIAIQIGVDKLLKLGPSEEKQGDGNESQILPVLWKLYSVHTI